MKLGKVTGKVTVERSTESLREETVLLVEMEGNTVAALDRTGCWWL